MYNRVGVELLEAPNVLNEYPSPGGPLTVLSRINLSLSDGYSQRHSQSGDGDRGPPRRSGRKPDRPANHFLLQRSVACSHGFRFCQPGTDPACGGKGETLPQRPLLSPGRWLNSAGVKIATQKIELPAMGHQAKFLSQLFPSVTADMNGTLVLTGPLPFTVAGLELDRDLFTSIPVF